MKLLFINLALLLTTHVYAQTKLGIGLVSIQFDDKTVLQFYKKPEDKLPSKTIKFFYDQEIHGSNIRNLEQHQQWLIPEGLQLDYSTFVFRCLSNKGNWMEVITNNETGESYWLKKSKFTVFTNWEEYLKGMFAIERLSDRPQKIRSLPTGTSSEIKYRGEDCFGVKSMKGDWIEIFTPSHCDQIYTNHKITIKTGWIKWRQGNNLLINYFITS